MAGTRRKVGSQELIPKPKLLYLLSQMDSPRDKALVAFIYLTGCRISEIVGHTKKVMEKGEVKEEIKITPLTKESIELMPERALMLVHDVPCLKRRKDLPRRYIPIYIPKVREFFEIFMQYYKTLGPGQPLFPITRQRAWQIIKDKMGLFNHFFIHNRLTHLVVQDGFSDQDLKQLRGWSSTLPANSYVHMRWQDLARKMGAKVEDS